MLKDINGPEDLQRLSAGELEALAGELRREIIETVAKNGGHLSSNLGVVELTLALDSVFDYRQDRIIFDVGHQAYAHKLLTGRCARFDTLRRQGGISGFTSMCEDSRDAFTSGHASTSISAALGYCRARDLKGESGAVVAVIGDGALTGGMSYEAMNDAGQSGTGLIVVLNDNDMSISNNVGAISMHLTSIRQSLFYRNFKSGTRSVLNKIPLIGAPLFRIVERLRDMIKALIIGDNIFDSLGFKYVGPVDGHNIKQLTRVLKMAKNTRRPLLIHVVTQKGRGYVPAEEHPDKFHGATPFDIETGEPLSHGSESLGAIAAERLSEIAAGRDDICAITAAMPTGTGLSVFADKWPKRFFDVGIAEEHAVTMAAGLAASGMKPYVAVYSTFLQRAYDQISNDVCLNSLPVTFLIDRAGLVGDDGATHNGLFDLSYLRSLPNMTIAAPRDARMLRRMIDWSVDFSGPLTIRYPKSIDDLGQGLDTDADIVPGKWQQLLGGDVMLLAVGRMVGPALQATIALQRYGIAAGVVDAMFVKPLDTEMLAEIAKRARLIVTIEENTLCGGFGEAVLDEISRMSAKCDVLTLGAPDEYIRHATVSQQQLKCGLDKEGIARAIRERLAGGGEQE